MQRHNQRKRRWYCYFLVLLLVVFSFPRGEGKSLSKIAILYRGGKKRPLPSHPERVPPNYGYANGYPGDFESNYNNQDCNEAPRGRRRRNRRDEEDDIDLVSYYTRSSSLKLLVAASAAASSFLLTHFLLLMILGTSHWSLLLLSALINASFVFLQGDFADFTRSLGVFAILLSQKFTIHQFLPKCLRQVNAALLFTARKPFPPSAHPDQNPWRYIPVSEQEDLQFSMTNTLLAMILFGAVLGWSFSKPIPLFPAWLGAILGASFLGYATSFQDARGDLLRYLGFTLLSILSEIWRIAEEVALKEKTSLILSHCFFFCQGIDQQFQIVARFKRWLSLFLVQVTSLLYSMRGESLPSSSVRNHNPPPHYRPTSRKQQSPYSSSQEEGNNISNNRRRRGSFTREEEEGEGDEDYYDDRDYPPPPSSNWR